MISLLVSIIRGCGKVNNMFFIILVINQLNAQILVL